MLRIALIAVMAVLIQVIGNVANADGLSEPKLIKGTTEYQFRTRLRQCADEGVNFNRHYTVCSINQGTDFQINFMIDRETGKVELIMSSELGVEMSPNSNILVVNPEFWMSPGDEVPSWLSRRYYLFDETTKEFVLIKENRDQTSRPAE